MEYPVPADSLSHSLLILFEADFPLVYAIPVKVPFSASCPSYSLDEMTQTNTYNIAVYDARSLWIFLQKKDSTYFLMFHFAKSLYKPSEIPGLFLPYIPLN